MNRTRTRLAWIGLAVLMAMSVPGHVSADEQDANYTEAHGDVVRKMSSARSLYLLKCSGCHGVDGAGAPAAGVPPFPGFVAPLARNPDGRRYIAHVPGIVASRLSNEQLVSVLNYVIEEWSSEADAAATPRFTVAEFAELRAAPVSNIVDLRRDVVAQLSAAGDPVADYPWP